MKNIENMPEIQNEEGYLTIKDVRVRLTMGLYTRPCSKFVEESRRYSNEICIGNPNKAVPEAPSKVDGKKILELMMLAAEKGKKLDIHVENEIDSNYGTRPEEILIRLYSGLTTEEESPDFDRFEYSE